MVQCECGAQIMTQTLKHVNFDTGNPLLLWFKFTWTLYNKHIKSGHMINILRSVSLLGLIALIIQSSEETLR